MLALMGFALTPQRVEAQQIPQYTHYMFNSYLINPAEAGTHNFYQIRSTNRYQWVGVRDAPQTYSISAYGPHAEKSMGFGGAFSMDITGPSHRMGGSATYGYNMQLNRDMRISGGVSLGFIMFRVDGTKLSLGDAATGYNDPAIFSNSKSKFTPDASLGVYLYSMHYIVGLSAHQLFGQTLFRTETNRRDDYGDIIVDDEGDPLNYYGINRLRQHLMLNGGYILPINRDWTVKPSALIKYMIGAPLQVDINARAVFQNMAWFGATARLLDGFALLFGYEHEGKIMIGYSFDFSLTGIRRHHGGSHEVMIGYKFDKLK